MAQDGDRAFPNPEALQQAFVLGGCEIVARELPPRWVGALLVEEGSGAIEIQLNPAESESHAEALGMIHGALSEPARKRWHRFGESWIYRVHWEPG